MKRVAWLSRHGMTTEQRTSLVEKIGDIVKVEQDNHLWQASDKYEFDMAINERSWQYFSRFDVVCGVFPPAALESLPVDFRRMVLTPISTQAKSDRKNGKAYMYKHARWSVINEGRKCLKN